MPWKTVQKDQTRTADPRLTIYGNGGGYLNTAAIAEFFDGADAVVLHTDTERDLIGFEVDPDGEARDSYSLSRDDDNRGADVRTNPALESLGIDPESVDETHFVDLADARDDPGPVVATADVSELRDDGEEVVADETPVEESPDPDATTGDRIHEFVAGKLGAGAFDQIEMTSGFLAESLDLDGRAVAGTLTNVSWDDLEVTKDGTDEDGNTLWVFARPSDDEGEGLSDDGVAEIAEQVETVQELADILEVGVPKARNRAKAADVYRDLRDEVPRPGVDRQGGEEA